MDNNCTDSKTINQVTDHITELSITQVTDFDILQSFPRNAFMPRSRSFDSFASHWIIEKLNTSTNKSGFIEQDSFELVVQKNFFLFWFFI